MATALGIPGLIPVGGGGGADTLQEAYDASTQPQIVLTAAEGGVQIRDAAVPIAASLFAVQNNAGTTDYLNVHDGGIDVAGTIVIAPASDTSAIVASATATAGTNIAFDFAYTISGNFTSVRALLDSSVVTAASFSYSLLELGPTFNTVTAGGGAFSFITGVLMVPEIDTATGTLRNLTGFFYAPVYVDGFVTTSYGIYIQDTMGAATTEIGGHFSGDEGALQVGTGAIAGPTVNGRWFQNGDCVMGASAMIATERLRVVGTSRLEGTLEHTTGSLGFYGTAPVAQSAAYTVTNVTPDRGYDANATTVNELADVLGTLIADLQLTGIIG